ARRATGGESTVSHRSVPSHHRALYRPSIPTCFRNLSRSFDRATKPPLPSIYWKYPVTSINTWTLPLELNTARSFGSVPSPTTAPFASAWSVLVKLIVETFGRAPPVGQTVRKLAAVAPVTVTLIDTAAAVVGTPHTPRIGKLRCCPVPSAGPPRVSTARQGVMAKNEY